MSEHATFNGHPTERHNGKGTLGRTKRDAARLTKSDSDRDEEQQNQLTRWIIKREWTRYIQEDRLRNRPSCVVSIFRVPKFLKDIKKETYVPQRVSLGPLHHGSAELPPMGHHKGRALHRMMIRFNNNRMSTMFNTNRDLVIEPNNMDFAKRAMEEILKLENQIRDSYEENIDCNGKTLAMILSLDGCFLLEVLRTLGGHRAPVAQAGKYYDPIFGENKLEFAAVDILFDILMLENQIPLVVLRKLLELELNSAVDVEKLLLEVLVRGTSLLSSFSCININIEQWSWPRPVEEEVHHLLGFLHSVIASPPSCTQDEPVDQGECSISIDCCSRKCILMLQGKSKAQNEDESIPHATELRNAGIKFKPLQGGIKEIKFDENSATIFLPPISIMDSTEREFRNLIAYEMCKPFETNYLICYMNLMDDLIDSEQDVALLRRMGVLINWMGSDKEVADLFNGLGKGVTLSKRKVFRKLRKDVNAHYKSKMKVQFAEFVREYFSSPWKASAWAAAIVGLLLTVLQTIFTIIPTYKK